MSRLSEIRVLDVWRALGGPEPRRGRAPAFWRGSRDLNVNINAERGVFFDHARSRGGGALTLVETVLNCSRTIALAWLEAEGFIEPRTLTDEQRCEHKRRKDKASSVAMEIERWRDAFTIELNARKLAAVKDGNDETLECAASLCNVLENGPPEDIIRAFIRLRAEYPAEAERFAALGEEREREARWISAKVVLMLAQSAEVAGGPHRAA